MNRMKTIHDYHFECLKTMFRVHYNTWYVSKKYKNKYWTLHLSDPVIHEFRVHLSWVVVKDPSVFYLTRLQIGIKILKIFKKRKILEKQIENVKRDETVVNIYMEHDLD